MEFVINLLNSEDLLKNIKNEYQVQVIQQLYRSLEASKKINLSFPRNISNAIYLLFKFSDRISTCSELYNILSNFVFKLETILKSRQYFIPQKNFSEITTLQINKPLYIQTNNDEFVDLKINEFNYCNFSPNFDYLKFDISKYLNDFMIAYPNKINLENEKLYVLSLKFTSSNKLGYKLVYQNFGNAEVQQVKSIVSAIFENNKNSISKITYSKSFNLTEFKNDIIFNVSFIYKNNDSIETKSINVINKSTNCQLLEDGNYTNGDQIINKDSILKAILQTESDNLYTVYYSSLKNIEVNNCINIYFNNGINYIPKIYLMGEIYQI